LGLWGPWFCLAARAHRAKLAQVITNVSGIPVGVVALMEPILASEASTALAPLLNAKPRARSSRIVALVLIAGASGTPALRLASIQRLPPPRSPVTASPLAALSTPLVKPAYQQLLLWSLQPQLALGMLAPRCVKVVASMNLMLLTAASKSLKLAPFNQN